MEQAFAKFKTQFGTALAETKELDINDVSALVQPLANEDLTDKSVWDNFAQILLSREHKIPVEEHLQTISKFAWSFNKVGYFGQAETRETMKQVWKLIE